jgi:hypothetical protein
MATNMGLRLRARRWLWVPTGREQVRARCIACSEHPSGCGSLGAVRVKSESLRAGRRYALCTQCARSCSPIRWRGQGQRHAFTTLTNGPRTFGSACCARSVPGGCLLVW